jgi:hypothetical protein
MLFGILPRMPTRSLALALLLLSAAWAPPSWLAPGRTAASGSGARPTSPQAPGAAATAATPGGTYSFRAATAGEAVARITASCKGCDWGAPGREAVVLELRLGGEYSQHVFLTRAEPAEYRVLLGPVPAGSHTLAVARDARLSAAAGEADVASVSVDVVPEGTTEHLVLSYAPIVYARPDTVGGFNDVPLLSWVEQEEDAGRRRFKYSVIFSHEDGGTPTDRLMATWGRATDIEFIYGVEIDRAGRIVKEEYQGPKHEILPFEGEKLGKHPLLWVVTLNNMVSDRGETRVRTALAPVPFTLENVSREVVMDEHPWTYRVMARELEREGRIRPEAPGGQGFIPDPRQFAYLEACGALTDAAIAFDVGVAHGGRVEWHPTDRGVSAFRIVRSGCFRAAAPLPPGVAAEQITRVRLRAYTRPAGRDEPPLPPDAGRVRLDRLNTVFLLDDQYRPGAPLMRWTGTLEARAGDVVEID